jgi:ankyrin repeat protein
MASQPSPLPQNVIPPPPASHPPLLPSQSGADINAFNTMGWAPLHCAASSGSAEMVRLLLQVASARGAAACEKRVKSVTFCSRV